MILFIQNVDVEQKEEEQQKANINKYVQRLQCAYSTCCFKMT